MFSIVMFNKNHVLPWKTKKLAIFNKRQETIKALNELMINNMQHAKFILRVRNVHHYYRPTYDTFSTGS